MADVKIQLEVTCVIASQTLTVEFLAAAVNLQQSYLIVKSHGGQKTGK